MAWKTFEVREIRPNHFVTLIDGKVTRPSTPFDHEFKDIFRRCQGVDAETVAMAIGFSALTVLFVTQSSLSFLRLMGILAFYACAAGSISLLECFITQKIPHIIYRSLERTSKVFPLWFIQYRLGVYKEFLKKVNSNEKMDTDLAYLIFSIGFEFSFYSLIIWTFVLILEENKFLGFVR